MTYKLENDIQPQNRGRVTQNLAMDFSDAFLWRHIRRPTRGNDMELESPRDRHPLPGPFNHVF